MIPFRFLELNRVKCRHSLLLQKLHWETNPGYNVPRLCSRTL